MAKQELSYDVKFVTTLILLFVFYPVGVVLMYKWMKWPTWLKTLIVLPLVLFTLIFIMAFVFGISGNLRTKEQTNARIEQAVVENKCTKECATSNLDIDACVEKCVLELKRDK